jgi:hypothetical protein
MYIQGMGSINHAASKPPNTAKTRVSGESVSKSLFTVSDTYESSADSAERKALLQDVKKKIKSGFYNTEPVIEDLSHGFAKILNQIQ